MLLAHTVASGTNSTPKLGGHTCSGDFTDPWRKEDDRDDRSHNIANWGGCTAPGGAGEAGVGSDVRMPAAPVASDVTVDTAVLVSLAEVVGSVLLDESVGNGVRMVGGRVVGGVVAGGRVAVEA